MRQTEYCSPLAPGDPKTQEFSAQQSPHLPVASQSFGVCLGHQAIGHVYGGRVIRAPHLVHGKTSQIEHDGTGVFEDLPTPLMATRYHSLVVERESMPSSLRVTASTEDGLIMGMRHRGFDVEGVQFHPESVLTQHGHQLVANFLRRAGLAVKN